MTDLGIMARYGVAGPIDLLLAISWFKKAAEAGDGRGMICWAHALDNGIGIIADQAEAAKWYQKVREMGDQLPTASFALGRLYWNGMGVPRDRILGVELFRKAAELGDGDAKSTLRRADVQRVGRQQRTWS